MLVVAKIQISLTNSSKTLAVLAPSRTSSQKQVLDTVHSVFWPIQFGAEVEKDTSVRLIFM